MNCSPSLIGLDWGTTALRAFLLADDGVVIDSRTEPWGIMHVPHGDFAAAFETVTAEWRRKWRGLSAIAAGMVGSANGWVETPYRAAPAGVDELASALTTVPGADLRIVPGIAALGERPDVMRGEETQIAGALAIETALVRSLLVLPGTHSKWARLQDGRITEFTTFITGELFAVLREHSILGRAPVSTERAGIGAKLEDAFARGVRAAQGSPRGVAPLLFSARALVVTDRLAGAASLHYLSGLLIGDEVRCGLAQYGVPAALIGDAALCDRYVTALALFDIHDVPIIDGAAPAGLWAIARRAGLVSSAAQASSG
ncbi:MAG: 2-dehydro-3-deoxygalactonokinase [Gemmatimonadota bacterium]|nr:2-dehydro-3-deoxygalactonokinase [Gemmatimonadota bacterium]